jgi:GNAT superfamily N-acetyltransferase
MRARVLGPGDGGRVRALLATDPIQNVFVSSRVDAGVLWPGSSASLWGFPARNPTHLLHAGSNLVPVIPVGEAAEPAALAGFVEALGPRRVCQAICGPAPTALELWRRLSDRWGDAYARCREVRPRQPVMVTDRINDLAPSPVRGIAPADFDSYFAASVAMYTEEVGVDPAVDGGRSSYRAHCRSLVEDHRAFGIVENGEVVFKADIGISSSGVAQIQGVWLTPRRRGHGLAAPAMAATTRLILKRHAVAALYVNDFNVRAVRTYLTVGFHQVGEFATILY